MELAVGASAATLKSLLSKLGSLLSEEYALIRGVRGDIQFINDELASMQAFLTNLSKSGNNHDDQTEDWMKQVRDVAYDIEDCIDDFAHSLRQDPRGNDLVTAAKKALYEIRTWRPRRAIAAQVVELKRRAQQVGERRARYGVRDPEPGKGNGLAGLTEHGAAEHQHAARQLVRVKQPVGPDMTKLERWMAFDGDNKKKPGVLSIVGFGGVGKTTVAMALYKKFGPDFECRATVTVSQNSDPEVVLLSLLNQVRSATNNGDRRGAGSDGGPISGKKNPAIGAVLKRFKLPSPNQKEDSSRGHSKQGQPEQANNDEKQGKETTSQKKITAAGSILSQQDKYDSSQEKKIPVTVSILSRFKLPCRKDEDDGSTVLQKHRQIQAELKKYLKQNRYSRS